MLPAIGRSAEEIMAALDGAAAGDLDWRAGRHQGLVYWPGDEAVDVALEAMRRFYYSNPLLGDAFPSLVRIEADLLELASGLLHAPGRSGIVTTGGTESNLQAVWCALQAARAARTLTGRAELVAPFSAHPTFDKAARYFGAEVVRVPSKADCSADVAAMANAVTSNTVLLVGSAPDYSHGIVDPIAELGALAIESSLPLHVDGCVGGFMLPFVERLGRAVPSWDFRVPGVTSISADVHKHGLGPKGVSVMLTREPALASHATFEFVEWPHGAYTTSTIGGSRSGAVLAGAWAVSQFLGEAGYLDIARTAMELTDAFVAGIREIPGLRLLGEPPTNKFAFTSVDADIMAIANGMSARGWHIAREAAPEAIGMHAQPFHADAVGPYVEDLAAVTELARAGELGRDEVGAAYN
jgi:glutamate/tyrosine decarboxylase-like PLP-dependent enzyme